MTRRPSVPSPASLLACAAALLALGGPLAACNDDTSGGDAQPVDLAASPDGGGGDGGNGPESFTRVAAASLCRALYRCCKEADRTTFFQGYLDRFSANPEAAAFADKVPPKAQLSAADCPDVLRRMLEVTPFSTWMEAIAAGQVSYDPAATAACAAKIDGAACGLPVAAALYDGTCFSYLPPVGGDEQRRMFKRTRGAGQACRIVRDGFGGVFYGTCDPNVAFCCFVDPAAPDKGCTLPGTKLTEGTCQAAANVGEACRAITTPLKLCKTGAQCSNGTCVADLTGPLKLGDECANDFGDLLGVCQQSWCDSLGTKRCEVQKADGAECLFPDECKSGACEQRKCGASTYCTAAS